MLKQARQWIAASRRRRWTAGALGGAALIVGVVWIVLFLVGSSPPDFKTASKARIVAYLQTDVTSKQRTDFLLGQARRYAHMSQAQREAFAKRMGPKLMERIKAQVRFLDACRLAKKYQTLPPAKRGPFLDRVLLYINAMGQGSRFLGWLDSNPMAAIVHDPNSIQHKLSPFEQRLVLGTTADQRADLAQLGGDLLRRAKEHAGK